ncbi:P44/Msp2 family outer membrane protein [Candidatus Neoehrlichia procyonis]|uniref:Surface antigen family protein n=1 Tax=Candidatus Neoehrlichia procyonis str. RAC413 TaxID=1359163 RepID=A0A0F3NNY8_9RICK|nr:P44/Msp2 family outer membrane protein [Candidatus Neoehrlichia lotoris]KJV69417.1 surface antigen family protein [Candidatus Neoehrlichia lotoris str. RAC413]
MIDKVFSIKNVFIALAAVLVSTNNVSASNCGCQNSTTNGLYVSAYYSPTLSLIKNFTIGEHNNITKAVFGYKKDKTGNDINTTNIASFAINNPEFQYGDNLLSAFHGAIGCFLKSNLRGELEIGYENFSAVPNNEMYNVYALSRNSAISSSQYVTVKIDAINTVSLMANTCYDFINANIVPYICAGLGGNFVKITHNIVPKFSYKIKLGTTFKFNPKILIAIGGFYHGIFGNKYKYLLVDQPVQLSHTLNLNNAIAEFNFSYFGGEIGVRFMSY